jgi:hypothetical protein
MPAQISYKSWSLQNPGTKITNKIPEVRNIAPITNKMITEMCSYKNQPVPCRVGETKCTVVRMEK